MSEVEKSVSNTAGTAKIVYILYLISLIVGITSVIGVVLAYVNRDDAPGWLQTHYRFQIRTFWIGLLYLTVGIILTMAVIGALILGLWLIWMIVRCAKGLNHLSREEAYPNVETWGI